MRLILATGYAFGWGATVGWILNQPGPRRTVRQVAAAAVVATTWPAAIIVGAIAHTIRAMGDD